MHVKYRQRFFRLLDVFLGNGMVSSNTAASFVKRLLSLGLNAPPGGILLILGFCYNMFKRHPSLFPMIHVKEFTKEHLDGVKETFDFLELDTNLTGAIGSYAWEILEFEKHWHPIVSGFSKVFSEAFVNQEYDIEDFLDVTYNGLIEDESRRKVGDGSAMTGVFTGIKSDEIFCF